MSRMVRTKAAPPPHICSLLIVCINRMIIIPGEQGDVRTAETVPDCREEEIYYHQGRQKDTAEKPQALSLSDGGFRVPTPQLHFSETWESNKSLPSSATHSSSKRPHSCHHSEVQQQTSKIEPYMSPATTWAVSPSPTHTYVAPPTAPSPTLSTMNLSTLSLRSSMAHTMPLQSAESTGMGYPPVMYNAWTTAKPNTPNTRHTTLTSSRLMTK